MKPTIGFLRPRLVTDQELGGVLFRRAADFADHDRLGRRVRQNISRCR
jgi:hypothetical protein